MWMENIESGMKKYRMFELKKFKIESVDNICKQQ